MRLQMPMGSVGIDHADRHDLFAAVDDASTGGSGVRRGHGSTIAAQGKSLEKGAPRGVDRIGVFLPLLVEGLEDRGVGVGGKGGRVHFSEKKRMAPRSVRRGAMEASRSRVRWLI